MDLAFWQNFVSEHIGALGLAAGMKYALIKARSNKTGKMPAVIRVRPRGLSSPILLRGLPSSDSEVFDWIFVKREYSCLDDLDSPKLILDLGANIGVSARYFANRFPSADLIALEPDPQNFERLKLNVAGENRIAPILGAAWHSPGKLLLSRGIYGNGKEWATQVIESFTDGDVPAYDLPSLIGARIVDLLKIDIERAEIPLFSRNTEAWLPSVRNICIELHDSECEAIFFNALRDYDYDRSQSGELTICRDLRPKSLR